MEAIHKQTVRERVDAIRDMLIGAQAMPKDITKYTNELLKQVGDSVTSAGNDAKAFMSRNSKMVKPPKAKPKKK